MVPASSYATRRGLHRDSGNVPRPLPEIQTGPRNSNKRKASPPGLADHQRFVDQPTEQINGRGARRFISGRDSFCRVHVKAAGKDRQARAKNVHVECIHARSGELDGERDAIQLAAQLGHGGGIFVVQAEPWPDG